MIQRAENWGPYVAALVATMGFMLFALAGLYTFRQQQHVNAQLCQQTVDNRAATRETWNAARLLVNKGRDQESQKRTNDFFDAVLRAIPPLKCIDNKPVEEGEG